MSSNFELTWRVGKPAILPGPSSAPEPDDGRTTHDAGEDGALPAFSSDSVIDRGEPASPAARATHTANRIGWLSEAAQEQIVKLVQRVFLFSTSSAPRVVLFSSVDMEGRSSDIVFHAAMVLATHSSASVCLVDPNLEEPLLPERALLGSGTLQVVPLALSGVGESRNLTSETLSSRLEQLRNTFDYVLIDAAPISSSSYPVLLGQLADGIILILEAGSTRRQTACAIKDTLEAANVTLLGAILNNYKSSSGNRNNGSFHKPRR